MDGIDVKLFILGEEIKSKNETVIFAGNQTTRQRIVIIETRTLQVQAKGIEHKEIIRLKVDMYLQLPIEKKNFGNVPVSWIVVHPVIFLKNLCGSIILVQE
ncbi:hypothetical protein TNCV_4164601 [Trichonephila clavipes]|nr:hypothetical protein TNCV_4164601 [Trichonephila clavipes]